MTTTLKQRAAAIISLIALAAAMLFGVAHYEASQHVNTMHPVHAAIHTMHSIGDDGSDVMSRRP